MLQAISIDADGTRRVIYAGQEYLADAAPLSADERAQVLAFVPPAPTPPPVPAVVSMRQARLALLGAGLMPQVAAALEALPSPQREAAQIEWEYSNEVHRYRLFVQTLGATLGLTNAQLDALFVAAAQL